MKKIFTLLFFGSFALSVHAQTIVNRHADIDKMVKSVNADSLKSYITKMVSFGTRSTISDTKSKTKGIGAARNWVVNKFNQFAKQGDGRLTAFLDTVTINPDGKRIDKQILLGNAVAILKGTDANDKRVFLVSGHLDSRVTDVMNRVSDAPGANDDGSGVAGVGQTVADKLIAKNYTVDEVANAPEGAYAAYEVYKIGEGNTATAAKLAELYGVTVKTTAPPVSVTGETDFVIIVGADPNANR